MPRDIDTLKIGSPCDADWDAMDGGGSARGCARCDRTIHDLSAMTRDQAQRFLDEAPPGRVCARGVFEPGGGLVTLERLAGWVRRQVRVAAPAAGALSVMIQPGSCQPSAEVEAEPAAQTDRWGPDPAPETTWLTPQPEVERLRLRPIAEPAPEPEPEPRTLTQEEIEMLMQLGYVE